MTTATEASVNGNAHKLSANQKKKLKRKEKRTQKLLEKQLEGQQAPEQPETTRKETRKESEDVEIEYVPEKLQLEDPAYAAFAEVIERFNKSALETGNDVEIVEDEKPEAQQTKKEEDEDSEKEDETGEKKLSKKKLRKLRRLTVAELKRLVKKPDVVEWVDVTAADPGLLVALKATRNTVPVPRHWSQKRKYLQGKRGIEKPPFELPDFIKMTGITEMRDAIREKEENMKMSQKLRERMQPKMGKLEIDYQKLHDAFFRWQTKPNMTTHGDLYYEGREFEIRLKEKKPGVLSEELKNALAIPPGAPPPWLINMQRYGPPPSYPALKIPGLNAPIPPGAQWGYHPGGWGKPPVDEYGRPLYGDVFGTAAPPPPPEYAEPVEKEHWGKIEEEEEEEEEQESEAEEEAAKEKSEGPEAEADEGGLVTPSGQISVASGLDTPATLELRKDIRRGDETPDEPRALYTVLPQKEVKGTAGAFMGSAYVYDINAAKAEKTVGAGVEVALDPSEVDNLDEAMLKAKFEKQTSGKDEGPSKEDFSDMVAEHAAKESKKRKKTQDDKSNKKYKDFKF